MDTQPSDSAHYGLSSHYEGSRGAAYQAQREARPLSAVARWQAERFRPWAGPDLTVVDFGCGTGDILAALPACRRIGVEPNQAASVQAEARGIACVPDTGAVETGMADVVISNHALEHVPYPIQALTELRRILKPDGVLVLVVPVEPPHRAGRYRPDDPNHHLHTWTAQLLGNTLTEAGFRVRPEDIVVVSDRLPRQVLPHRERLPAALVAAIGWTFARIKRYREIMAVARPSHRPS